MSMKSNDDVGYGAVLVREKLKKYKVRMGIWNLAWGYGLIMMRLRVFKEIC